MRTIDGGWLRSGEAAVSMSRRAPALGAGGRWPGHRRLAEGGFESSRPDQ